MVSCVIIIILSLCFFPVSGQDNLIQNGTFSSTDSWNLGVYSSEVTGMAADGRYLIEITDPGADAWSIQFTQSQIPLDSNVLYRFSFDASSTVERTIEASVCRDGGDYFPYSGRDTINLTPTEQTFELVFAMTQADTSARVEFNCGKYNGDISISNVQLIQIPGPRLCLDVPEAGAVLFESVPVKISWTSLGNNDPLVIELSVDNGLNWMKIADSVPNNGSFSWVPSGVYSPWCFLRIKSVSDESLTAETEMPFEITASAEKIVNGSFSRGDTGWNLGVYGGTATGAVTEDSVYRILIDSAGSEKWHIQFTQSGINLQKKIAYEFSFVAWADSNRTIRAEINRNDGSYENLLDSSTMLIELTSIPKKYVIDFTMGSEECPDARVEFNCGLDNKDVYIDSVSLIRKAYSRALPFQKTILKRVVQTGKTLTFSPGSSLRRECPAFSGAIMDLMGRNVGRRSGSKLNKQNILPALGLYIYNKEKMKE
ncbi:MAG: hypothetical protein GX556_04270 [Fibrobacter sp.]|nr:hypothetical protein [Fibrobacter sp.]